MAKHEWKACGWILATALLASGCRPVLSGTYASADGVGTLEFRESGRVYVTFADSTFAGEYELDGDRVLIEGPGGTHVCRMADDSLAGFGMDFERQQGANE